ncbi:hypothetical protein AWZ03_002208 [Drosophila navojoa]|uniref:Uncharacterized protein n=1 Tax=Drosophila navojoa TaxID=7232 RepID=A0A484BRP3_DRONA|nr:hypothetical protein AWZ03_002208 [Drosophila navojoa]
MRCDPLPSVGCAVAVPGLALGYAQLIDRQQRAQMLHFISGQKKSETWSSGAALRQRQLNLAFNKHGTQSKMESVSESKSTAKSESESELELELEFDFEFGLEL